MHNFIISLSLETRVGFFSFLFFWFCARDKPVAASLKSSYLLCVFFHKGWSRAAGVWLEMAQIWNKIATLWKSFGTWSEPNALKFGMFLFKWFSDGGKY